MNNWNFYKRINTKKITKYREQFFLVADSKINCKMSKINADNPNVYNTIKHFAQTLRQNITTDLCSNLF